MSLRMLVEKNIFQFFLWLEVMSLFYDSNLVQKDWVGFGGKEEAGGGGVGGERGHVTERIVGA